MDSDGDIELSQKGQLISEWLFDVLHFPKKKPQKFDESKKWLNQKDKGTLWHVK